MTASQLAGWLWLALPLGAWAQASPPATPPPIADTTHTASGTPLPPDTAAAAPDPAASPAPRAPACTCATRRDPPGTQR